MCRLDIVITMGGLGSRFHKAGYIIPKYMITAKGKTLFEWSLISLDGFRDCTEQFIFVAMRHKNEDVEAFIIENCKKLKIKNYRIIIIDYLTDGQAATAMLAEKYWNKKNGLLIYNIDTYIEAGEMKSTDICGDGFIPCFKGKGNHWSFVRLDKNGKVIEIKEKERISENCTVGAYYFKTCDLYKNIYCEYYNNNQENTLINGEKYVAPLYNYLLSKGGDIFISNIASDKVHVLGTPEELEVFLAE